MGASTEGLNTMVDSEAMDSEGCHITEIKRRARVALSVEPSMSLYLGLRR